MHLKFERTWKYMLLAPTLILAAGLMVALVPDVGRHYYTVDSPQVHEYEEEHEVGEQPGGHH
jgi:cytochrome c oxidase subunit 4